MSDTVNKYHDNLEYYWDEKPIIKINNILTPLQAQNILTRCILELENEELIKEVETLKEYLKSKL